MKNQMLLAFISVFVLGIIYFTYHAFIEEEVQEGLIGLKISTPLISIAYFIQQVGGEHVRVTSFLSADQDYHSLSLSPSQVIDLDKSDAFFSVNTPEEAPLIEKLEGSKVQIYNVAKGAFLIPFEEEEVSENENCDPHLWLGIGNMFIIAENIAQALIELDPKNEEEYRSNLINLQVRLKTLWKNISDVFSDYEGSQIVVMHASYGYFLEPFKIKQISLESFQRESSLKQLAMALSKVREDSMNFLLVQPQYDPEQASQISEQLGLAKIQFNPIYQDPFKEISSVLQAVRGLGER